MAVTLTYTVDYEFEQITLGYTPIGTVSGNFTFDFDETVLTGSSQVFTPTLNTFSGIQVGSTNFDINNVGLRVEFDQEQDFGFFQFPSSVTIRLFGNVNDSIASGDTDDFVFEFIGDAALGEEASFSDINQFEYTIANQGQQLLAGGISSVPTIQSAQPVPEPVTILGTLTALGISSFMKKKQRQD